MRVLAVLTTILAPCFSICSIGATLNFVDEFSSPGTNGWGGGTPVSNPGTGGVGGPGDGYLLISNSLPGNFGARSGNPAYVGDWRAAGITTVTFYLNDVNAPQAFEIHLVLATAGGSLGTAWQYNSGFSPPNGTWQKYAVGVTNGANWTRIFGTDTFETVLHNVGVFHLRHDLAPYVNSPDAISGDLGIDRIKLEAPCHAPRSDADGDGDVDLDDFLLFQSCFNGPNRPWATTSDPGACYCLDQDDDADVDLNDFQVFQSCFNGPNRPPAPACH